MSTVLHRAARHFLIVASLSWLTLSGCGPGQKGGHDPSLTEFATRYAAAWSSRDPEALAAFYAEDGTLSVNDGPPAVGREAIASKAREFMTAFPDMVVRLVELEVSGSKAVFRWHWTGTNTGPGGTGNAVDLQGYEEWTFDDGGLISESRGHYDKDEYDRQLNSGQPGR